MSEVYEITPMSSPGGEEAEEAQTDVEFVSEASVRPGLECIDLSSDSDQEADPIQDQIDRKKAHVASTLDRLARQVAVATQERANKRRAFREKQISQRAHGQGELTFGHNQDAKRCVDMWLKMPGPRPGVVNAGSGRRPWQTSFPSTSSTQSTCPVINCGRVYDNASLLGGHLKRFDHSPCDPSVHLRGSSTQLFGCVACGRHFNTSDAWRLHLQTKVSSCNTEGHAASQSFQTVVCFACPACCLLFNLRDECLQHMATKNHFTESIALNAPTGRALPLPVPQFTKRRLIALCKEVTFIVRCTICRKALNSHQTAQAHFNVCCRQGCAVAEADRSVSEVMKQLCARAQCAVCRQVFLSRGDAERHRESTGHDVERNCSTASGILQFCRFRELQCAATERERRRTAGSGAPGHKREQDGEGEDSAGFPAKRQKLGCGANGGTSRRSLAWVCECGARFSEEASAANHLLAANQIFHRCGVCDKLMGESAVTRLHMSRFHGGAHLDNFLFYCRRCREELPRHPDVLAHIAQAHGGHGSFSQKQVTEPDAKREAKPSTSRATHRALAKHAAPPPPSPPDGRWMCRMCEDVFNSEAAVRQHCGAVASHSFQRFVCGHCPQKFFKESTVRRHCVQEHGGQLKVCYFCGLCDSMEFEKEEEFSEHYERLHSKDYYLMDDGSAAAGASGPADPEDHGAAGPADPEDREARAGPKEQSAPQNSCPCMGSEKGQPERKSTYTRCMRALAAGGMCRYLCAPCGVSASSFVQIKTHVHTTHDALQLEKTFDVVCTACQQSFSSVPTFHEHYHARHCALAPCRRPQQSRPGSEDEGEERTSSLDCVASSRENQEGQSDEELNRVLVLSAEERSPEECDAEMKRALALSAEEARMSTDLDVVLQRSLLEF